MSSKNGKGSQTTSNNLNTDVHPEYDQLEERFQLAIEARLEGMKYKDIASILKGRNIQTTERTVRDWFVKGGTCADVYKDLKRERAKEVRAMFKKIRDEYVNIAPEAMLTIKTHVRRGNLSAAMHVMEVNGFEPVHKIEDVTPRTVRIMVVKPDGAEVVAATEGEQ
jgi:hypothetical protein